MPVSHLKMAADTGTAGMHLCQFVADWKQWPAWSKASSAKFLPIICRLIGKPPLENPQGTHSVGDPVRLVG